MLEGQFYTRLILNIIIGIMFAYALVKMAQYNNQEKEPKKHNIMKILGWIFVGLSGILLISCIVSFVNLDFPQSVIGPFISPNMIVRPTTSTFYWGYPTPIQNSILTSALGVFTFLGFGGYFLYFKSSKSKWWIKILKFLTVLFLYAFMASSTNLHYFDFPELVAPILFLVLWLIIINRKHKQQQLYFPKTQNNDKSEVKEFRYIPEENQSKPSIDSFQSSLLIKTSQLKEIEDVIISPIADINQNTEENEIIIKEEKSSMDNESYKETQIVSNDNIQFCRHCGKKIEADSTFCKYCGKKIKTSDEENDIHSLTVFSIFWKKMKFFLEKIKIPKNKFKVNKRKLKRIGIISLIVVGSLILLGGISGLIFYYFDVIKPEKDGELAYQEEVHEINSLKNEALYKKCEDIIARHNIKNIGKDWIDSNNLSQLIQLSWIKIKELAEMGNVDAQYILALDNAGYNFRDDNWNATNEAVAIDYEKAAYWYLQAAQQGHAKAQNNLGTCYKRGVGVPQNWEKAIYWYTKSAENGNSYGQLNLGDCYRDGVEIKVGSHKKDIKTTSYGYHEGEKIREYYDYNKMEFVKVYRVDVDDYEYLIPKDMQKAKFWWEKSAAQGNMQAKERLQKIY